MKNRKIFLMLLLIFTLVIFTATACSTNDTPNVPDTVDDNGNGGMDNNGNNGLDNNNNGLDNNNGNGGISSPGGITDNTNQ